MSRIDEAVVNDFIKIQQDLPETLKFYGLSARFVALQSGISVSSFHRKMKSQGFTGEEMKAICAVINR
ncbi:hypothetical protein [Flexithrix dorotheae]|uniref:hypothetical protein n=1 Tax=Flexithrix dorotheae TaxID=70993 RepID=UPI0012FCCF71|nr:hypothetical protein [Flexithrix dorotheae]